MSNSFEIKDNSVQCIQELHQKVEKALEMCGIKAEGYAIENITRQKAVDTGLLRNSITHVVSGGEFAKTEYKADKGDKRGSYGGTMGDKSEHAMYVGTNVEYGVYIEFGTGNGSSAGGKQTPWRYKDKDGGFHQTGGTSPRPYIKPAISEHADEYRQIITDVLKS